MFKKIACAILLLTASHELARAALMVTPDRQEITLPPGGTYQASYWVTNGYPRNLNMRVETRYWYATKEEEKNVPITDWLTVTPSSFTFVPNQTVEVKYNVKLSTSATGVRTAMVSFVPQEGDQMVTLVVSVSLFVTVQGTEKTEWDFSDFKITTYQGKTQLSVIATNSGNVHVRPYGAMKIVSKKNPEITLNVPESRPVYPGKTRQIIASGDEKDIFPKPGKYKITVSLGAKGETKEKSYDVSIDKHKVITIK